MEPVGADPTVPNPTIALVGADAAAPKPIKGEAILVVPNEEAGTLDVELPKEKPVDGVPPKEKPVDGVGPPKDVVPKEEEGPTLRDPKEAEVGPVV